MSMKKCLFGAAMFIGIADASMPANSAVVIDVQEVGGNLVFTTTGSLDLTGASFLGGIGYADGFISGGSNWYVASGNGSSVDNYAMTSFDGPFGTNFSFISSPSSTSGDDFFIWGNSGGTEQVGVNVGYISGSLINSTMTFLGLTIAGAGLLSGTYNYAIPSDKITLNIGGRAVVPLPAALPLLASGIAGMGLMGWRRKRKAAASAAA